LSNPVNCYRIVAEKLQYTVKRKLDNNPKIVAASPSKKQCSQEKLAVLQYVHVLVIYSYCESSKQLGLCQTVGQHVAYLLHVPCHRLNTCGRRAFATYSAWNSLLDPVRNPNSTKDAFRRLLKTFFARYQFTECIRGGRRFAGDVQYKSTH